MLHENQQVLIVVFYIPLLLGIQLEAQVVSLFFALRRLILKGLLLNFIFCEKLKVIVQEIKIDASSAEVAHRSCNAKSQPIKFHKKCWL